jgi:hypothetical protein
MTVGGVDTYYDYDEQRWKFRRLGGGPVRVDPVCPAPTHTLDPDDRDATAGSSSLTASREVRRPVTAG